MDFSTWLAFFAAAWAISLSPGPGALAAMSAGLNHGFRKGYFTTLGLVLGIWVQLVVVGVGLGAVLATSATAFVVVKWAGVAYLVYLGVQQWRAPVRPLAELQAGAAHVRRRDLVLRGLLINIVNPKGTVFLLAVVPQFLTLSQPLTPQYLVIAATLGFTDLTVMAGYTALAAKVLGTLKSARAMKWTNRTFGGLFVAAGALLSVFKRTA
jgi:homoserine/homoserine lactone efflux protein